MPILPRVCLAVDKNAKGTDRVRMAYYRCKASGKRLLTNRTAIPYSPYTGKFMSRIGQKSVRIPVSEIRADLISIGNCPQCDDNLFVWPATAKVLNGKRIHCVVCNAVMRVKVSAEDLSTIDVVNEHNEENQARRLTHDNVDEDAADTSLIHANADDDDDDDAGELGNGDDDDDDDQLQLGGDDDDDDAATDITAGGDDDDDATITNSGDDDDDDDDDGTGDLADADVDAKLTAPGSATPNPSDPVPQPKNKPPAENPGDNAPTDQLADNPPVNSGDDDDDAAKGDDDDDDDDDKVADVSGDEMADDIVSAAAKEFVINCWARTGDLSNKAVSFAMLSPRIAIIAVDGDPVIKLEADKAGENEGLFAEPENLAKAINAVLAGCEAKKDYSGNPFAALGGVPITYRIGIADEIKTRIASGITAVTANTAVGHSAVLDDVKQSLTIAGLIISRNADKELVNPLRVALVKTLSALNVQNAETVVDKAMEEAGDPFIDALLTKTRELMEKPATARNEIAKFVERTPYRTPERDNKGNMHRTKFAASNVKLSTAAAEDGIVLPEKIPVVAAVEGGAVEQWRGLLRSTRR